MAGVRRGDRLPDRLRRRFPGLLVRVLSQQLIHVEPPGRVVAQQMLHELRPRQHRRVARPGHALPLALEVRRPVLPQLVELIGLGLVVERRGGVGQLDPVRVNSGRPYEQDHAQRKEVRLRVETDAVLEQLVSEVRRDPTQLDVLVLGDDAPLSAYAPGFGTRRHPANHVAAGFHAADSLVRRRDPVITELDASGGVTENAADLDAPVGEVGRRRGAERAVGTPRQPPHRLDVGPRRRTDHLTRQRGCGGLVLDDEPVFLDLHVERRQDRIALVAQVALPRDRFANQLGETVAPGRVQVRGNADDTAGRGGGLE